MYTIKFAIKFLLNKIIFSNLLTTYQTTHKLATNCLNVLKREKQNACWMVNYWPGYFMRKNNVKKIKNYESNLRKYLIQYRPIDFSPAPSPKYVA
jgi:hypothetical protein